VHYVFAAFALVSIVATAEWVYVKQTSCKVDNPSEPLGHFRHARNLT
jgi:hypothetical protein